MAARKNKSSKRATVLAFSRARKVEKRYGSQLMQVARQIGSIVTGMAPDGHVSDPGSVSAALKRYAELIRPWARAVGSRMLAEVSRKDHEAFVQTGKDIGRGLREEIAGAPIGDMMRKLLDEQVELITSLPLDAAQRVHKLTTESLQSGARADEIAAEILRSGHVSKSRAKLIARTEVGRTSTALTQARSQHIGATHYIWRTAEDSDVRELHKKLNGQVIAWADPPVAGENGERAHAGAIYNCRCFPEPIIAD